MRTRLKQLAASLFGLRRGERGLALWMFLYHYLLLVTLYLLKPIRDSFFLTEAGPRELPFVFILTTVVVIPMALLYARASRRTRLGWLVNGTTLVLVASLGGIYWMLGLEEVWVYYVLYVWVSIYGVLVTSQFWLFANTIFDAAQAKRTFAMLSVGAILGSVTGGEVTGLLVDTGLLDSRSLVPLAAAVLALTVLLVNGIRVRAERRQAEVVHREEPTGSEPVDIRSITETLRESRHLLLIIGIIAMAVLTTTMVDYQFKTVASRAFPTEDDLSAFMGRFYSRVSLLALLFQVFLAPRLIRFLGAGGSLLLLPTGLFVGSLWMLAMPGLIAGTTLRGIDQTLKHSIDKTGRELLFLPVELETKKRIKVFIDLFMDHGAQGLGGVLLLLLTLVLGLDVQDLSLVLLGLLTLWGGLVLLARYSYVEAFRSSLKEQVTPEEEVHDERDGQPTPSAAIYRMLSSRSAGRVAEGLRQLEENEARVPVSTIQRLLHHRSPEVRRHAIRVLRKRHVSGLTDEAAAHLEDHDAAVRLEAARYLYRELDQARTALVRRGLRNPDSRVRAVAVGLIAKEGGPAEYALLSDAMLRQLAEDEEADEEGRLQVARVLGVLDRPELNDLLHRLMDDPSDAVAARALRSAGRRGDRAFIHELIERLDHKGRRDAVLDALAAYGNRILGTLYDYVTDPHVPLSLRRALPDVAVRIGTQAAVDVLLVAIDQTPVPVREAIIDALSTLRAEGEDLTFSWDTVRQHVYAEARHVAALGQIAHLSRTNAHPASEALRTDVLEDARRRSLERTFRLLGLYYLQPDMHNALRGLTSDEQNLRAGALEFVDNLLDWDTKQFLLPLLDDATGEQAASAGSDTFDLEIATWPEAIGYMLRSDDPPLQVAALRCAAAAPDAAPSQAVTDATRHPDPDVRDAARSAADAIDDAS